jgi:gluconokinase
MLRETVELHEIHVSGGAVAKSAALRAGLTDALGRPIQVCTESEATLRGAAILALDALGTLDASAVGAELSLPSRPDPGRHAIYRKLEQERTARRPGYVDVVA